MKRMVMVVCAVFCFLVISLAAHASDIGTARLSLIQGDVVVLTQDTGNEWVAASVNLPLLQGDRVWVPQNGRTEVQFLGRTYLRADENTEVSISKVLWDRESMVIQTGMTEGQLYVNYRSYGKGSVFQVDTPLISLMAYENAQYDIHVRDDGFTEVSVLGGIVYADSPNGNTRVTRGNTISVGPGNYAEIYPSGPRSQWIRWNQSRDSQLVRSRTSTRYLPPELDVYGSDFDENGRWIYMRDYGYVWNPTVVVSGWAPYRHGRWVWTRGDYVWVSYEPWGWAPYHYGRWAFSAGIGWFWVPPAVNAVFWSPGFVAWIYTPTYVSWVPLAPREIYYGYGYYGPYSVNLTKVNIKNVNVTNVYVNSQVTNAVTVVHHDTFLTGKQIKSAGRPVNPFVPGARLSPGRPDIRPVKATAMPLPEKVVPQKSLPSQRMIEKERKTGLNARPVAVRKDVSVFRQGEQATSLPIRRLDKPKPAVKSDRHEKSGSADTKRVITERPQTAPYEPAKKSIEQPEVKGKQQIKGRPKTTREGTGWEQMHKKEEGTPPVIHPGPKEKPLAEPKVHGGKTQVQQRNPEKSFKQNELKNAPSVSLRGEMQNPSMKPGGAKNLHGKQKGDRDIVAN